MRVLCCMCLATLFLTPGMARAISEDKDEAVAVVYAKVEREERGVSPEEALRREEARRAEAAKKVDQIRNIPPERVQDWINGKLSEADLDKAVFAPPAQAPAVTLAVPRDRLNRLLLASVAVLVLACLYALQRRRARMVTAKKTRR